MIKNYFDFASIRAAGPAMPFISKDKYKELCDSIKNELINISEYYEDQHIQKALIDKDILKAWIKDENHNDDIFENNAQKVIAYFIEEIINDYIHKEKENNIDSYIKNYIENSNTDKKEENI